MALGNYIILESISASDLEKMVNDKMSKGWTPLGGVAMMVKNSSIIYAQALIRS